MRGEQIIPYLAQDEKGYMKSQYFFIRFSTFSSKVGRIIKQQG
jgi:hypothetical protein